MTATVPTVLMVPGYTNSGPQHWQSLWQAEHPEYRRVEQRDWDAPDVAEWTAALDRAIAGSRTAVVLVAHSLGCLTVAHWAARHPNQVARVAGALLVAPADVERPDTLVVLRGFAPIPRRPLQFASTVVASTTDDYITTERARELAVRWGARFVDVGDAGHLNTASGCGHVDKGRVRS